MTDNQARKLKVALICASDRLGGAAIVTFRLMHALQREGVDARMIVYTKISDSELVSVCRSRLQRVTKFAWERAVIYAQNGFDRDNLFKVSIANTGMPLHRHPWVKEADIINLNWINQGLLSLKGIHRLGRLGKPVVWTMHDMWPMTGICHHAYDCDRYLDRCGRCPQLGSHRDNDLSRRVWERKKTLYDAMPITFVGVSNWIADRARRSSLLKDRDIRVIPNAFPVDEFFIKPIEGYPSFDPMLDRRRIVFGAARLDDPIKGLDTFIDAANLIFDNNPQIGHTTGIIFFGAIRDRSKFDRLRFPYLYLGQVNDPKMLRQIYASSDVVVSTSQWENLPGTLIEGQAAGCIPVTFSHGGQTDIVEHGKTGWIAEYGSVEDVARGIEWALSNPIEPEALRASVMERFSAPSVARRYIGLYHSLLAEQKDLRN